MGISPSSAFGLDGHAASPRFITPKMFKNFGVWKFQILDVTCVLMKQDLWNPGGTQEDWT